MMTSEKEIGVGVIGAGWWATTAHIPAVREHPQARLIAVQSRSQEKASKIAHDFGAPYGMTEVGDVLARDDIDAVIISSTPNVHYGQTKAALQAGKHVLLEKPMTFTMAEAQELCDLAEAKNLHLLISCPWHYTRHGIKARQLIHDGAIGDIRMISILMTNPIDKLLKGINTTPTHGMDRVYVEPGIGSYNDPEIAGGGQIYCQVSHAAAYLTFLTGLQPVSVYAQMDFADSPNDIYDVLSVKMNNGALVSLASTAATPLEERNYEVRVYGTKGIILLELWKGTMEVVPFEGERTAEADLTEPEKYPENSPALNLIDTVLGRTPNGSDGRLGLASMKIIEGSLKSADSRQPVTLS